MPVLFVTECCAWGKYQDNYKREWDDVLLIGRGDRFDGVKVYVS